MKFNWDGWKHTVGALAVGLVPTLTAYELSDTTLPHRTLVVALTVSALALVAWLTGVQSEQMFVRTVTDEAGRVIADETTPKETPAAKGP